MVSLTVLVVLRVVSLTTLEVFIVDSFTALVELAHILEDVVLKEAKVVEFAADRRKIADTY